MLQSSKISASGNPTSLARTALAWLTGGTALSKLGGYRLLTFYETLRPKTSEDTVMQMPNEIFRARGEGHSIESFRQRLIALMVVVSTLAVGSSLMGRNPNPERRLRPFSPPA